MLFLYTVKYIRDAADRLIKRQHTTDPVELLDSRKSVSYKYVPMSDNVNGLYKYISPKKQILSINNYLEGLQRQYASFHELGHVVFKHKGRLLLNCLGVSDIKEEYEADLFSTYMVMRHNGITKENVDEFVLPKRVRELIHKFL
jgi:Zn-dependent peptidase ImmA (M78 family)